MTRLIGPDNADRLAYTLVTASGTMKNALKGVPLARATFYDDPDPTAEPTSDMLQGLADIRTLAGVAIPDSTVTINSVSQFPLIQFPDGTPYGPDSLLVQVQVGQSGTGPPYRLYARQDDRTDALNAALNAALARIAALEFGWHADGGVMFADLTSTGITYSGSVLTVDTLTTAGVTVDGAVLVVTL